MESSSLTRKLVIILLLSSALTICLAPTAKSQQYTTATTIATMTSIVTSSVTQVTTYYLTNSSILLATLTGYPGGTGAFSGGFTLIPPINGGASGNCYMAILDVPPDYSSSPVATTFEYSASGQMTLYIFRPQSAVVIAETFSGPNCGLSGPVDYELPISAASYPVSGNFTLNLVSHTGIYAVVLVAPVSAHSPSATVTVSPVSVGVENSMTVAATTTAATTFSVIATQTFFTTSEVPFSQTYEGWVVAATVAVVIFAVIWIVIGRKAKR